MQKRFYILESIRFIFILLFLYAALNKILDYSKFQNDLLNSPVFGNDSIAILLSFIVPTLELIIAGLLIFQSSQKWGLWLAASLMGLFTLYIAGVLLFSEDIPCSCGGIINNFTWQEHLVFNFLFLSLGVLGIILEKNKNYV